MINIEEIKKKLLSSDEEGANKASIYEEVLTIISEAQKQIEEMTQKQAEADEKITSLSDKANELTQTNLKLLDKIKYAEPDKEEPGNDEDDQPEIADLSTWYEE